MAGKDPGVKDKHCQFPACLKIHIEVKPQLQVAQVTIGLNNSGDNIIEVHKKGVCIQKAGCRQDIHLNDLSLLPHSCHGLRWVKGDGLHLRMQLAEGSALIPGKPEPANHDVFRSPSFTCMCKRCGHIVIEKKRFNQVLPMPSNNWEELADSWFCHRHDHTNEAEAEHAHPNPVLTPKDSDCLVGSRDFIVNSRILKSCTVTTGSSGCVRCQRCRSLLGTTFKGGTKSPAQYTSVQFSMYAVDVYDSVGREQKDCCSQWDASTEQWFCKNLLQEARTHNCFRLLVESKSQSEPPRPMLLLWVLDSQVVMYSGTAAGGKDLLLQPEAILKVMFKHCLQEESKGLSDSWRKDFGVHFLQFPEDVCLQLLHILIQSNRSMPRSLRNVDGFCLGFLRKSPTT